MSVYFRKLHHSVANRPTPLDGEPASRCGAGAILPRALTGLVVALAIPCAACTTSPGVEPAPDDDAPTAVTAIEAARPKSCAEIKDAASPGPLDDGEYLLFVGGSSDRPWVAYCRGMASDAPTEYLTLHRTTAANFSQYTAGGASPGTSARSRYTKVRIDFSSLTIDTSDQTFSEPSGGVHHGDILVTSMPYGVAMSCDGQPSGTANIDLQGTPFAVARTAFVVSGAAPSGTAAFSTGDQVVTLTAGGFCGAIQPAPGMFNPFNQNGGKMLTLVYR